MPGKIIPYNPRLTEYAREFRNNPTPSEALMWQRLKGKQIMGFDFHRQKPLGYFVVDFFCYELMLAIEIDGSVHNDEYNKIKDEHRQVALEQSGIRFLRFSSEDEIFNLNKIIRELEKWVDANTV